MRLTRRTTLALAAGVATSGLAPARAASGSPLRLWYRQPAQEWVEALPVGSGRMGAMVFGGVAAERLQLNEDTLWAGGAHAPANPEALKALPEIRALIDAGDYAKATEVSDARFMATPKRQMAYQTIGDLKLAFPGLDGPSANYVRELDLDGAIATTRFKIGATHYTRQVIGSYLDRVIAVRLSADKGRAISIDLTFESPLKSKPVSSVEGGDTLVLAGANDTQQGIAAQLK